MDTPCLKKQIPRCPVSPESNSSESLPLETCEFIPWLFATWEMLLQEKGKHFFWPLPSLQYDWQYVLLTIHIIHLGNKESLHHIRVSAMSGTQDLISGRHQGLDAVSKLPGGHQWLKQYLLFYLILWGLCFIIICIANNFQHNILSSFGSLFLCYCLCLPSLLWWKCTVWILVAWS